MPPPVSSEDKKFTGSSVDELSRIQPGNIDADTSGLRENCARAARVVSRAFKVLVTGKTVMMKKHHPRMVNKLQSEHHLSGGDSS